MNLNMISTSDSIPGYEIIEQRGIVTARVVVGVGFFSEFLAGFTDVVGGRSRALENRLNELYLEALSDLDTKVEEMGCNAAIGVKFDFDQISGKGTFMFMLSVAGTAVQAVKSINQSQVKTRRSFPNTVYGKINEFRICDTDVFEVDDNVSLLLKVKIYRGIISIIKADVRLDGIFGERAELKDQVFFFDKEINGFQFSHLNKIDNLKIIPCRTIKSVMIFPKMVAFEDGNILSCEKDIITTDIGQERIRDLRSKFGNDAFCELIIEERTWTCVCGSINEINQAECSLCRRNRFMMLSSQGNMEISDLVNMCNDMESVKTLIKINMDKIPEKLSEAIFNDIYQTIRKMKLNENIDEKAVINNIVKQLKNEKL